MVPELSPEPGSQERPCLVLCRPSSPCMPASKLLAEWPGQKHQAAGCKLQDCVHVHVFRKQALFRSCPASKIPLFYSCLHSCADNVYVNVGKVMKTSFVKIIHPQGEKRIQEIFQSSLHSLHPPKHASPRVSPQCWGLCVLPADLVFHYYYY